MNHSPAVTFFRRTEISSHLLETDFSPEVLQGEEPEVAEEAAVAAEQATEQLVALEEASDLRIPLQAHASLPRIAPTRSASSPWVLVCWMFAGQNTLVLETSEDKHERLSAQ